MRRIFLRLIEDVPSGTSEEQRLAAVQSAVETIVHIEWEMKPTLDIRGGYKMSGMIPEDTDLDECDRKLKAVGYLGVI